MRHPDAVGPAPRRHRHLSFEAGPQTDPDRRDERIGHAGGRLHLRHPDRTDARRRQRPAAVGAARPARLDQPTGTDLQGAAGPDLVAGRDRAVRRGPPRELRHSRRVVPPGDDGRGAQRALGGPARIPHHRRRRRLLHGVPNLQRRPAACGRPQGGNCARCHHSGSRPLQRRARLRLAQRRPHRFLRVSRDLFDHCSLRSGARQLRRHNGGQPSPRLRPQHLDRLQDRPRHRRHHVATRRQEERFQPGSGSPLRLAT